MSNMLLDRWHILLNKIVYQFQESKTVLKTLTAGRVHFMIPKDYTL
jgi:hypothetical protein